MHIRHARYACCALILCALGASAETGRASRDPLDTPAAAASSGERSQLVSIARAGEQLVAVGRRGLILASPDAGKTWKQVPSPVSADLTSVRFSDPRHGWITGHDAVVLRSRDGGATWERKLDGRAALKLLLSAYGPAGRTPNTAMAQDAERAAAQSATPGVLPYPLLDAWFSSPDEGFVAGAFGLLLRTTDGGATWSPWLERAENTKMNHIYALSGTPAALYLAGEQGLLRRLDSGGERFATVASPYQGSFFGLYTDGDVAVAHGLRGNAYLSRDGGAVWRKIDTGSQANIVAVLPGTGAELVVVTQSGEVVAVGEEGSAPRPLQVKRSGEIYGAATLRGVLVTTGLTGARAQAVAALSVP
jgi:photosystem II stability/assembly factor-like uncharacterized protein